MHPDVGRIIFLVVVLHANSGSEEAACRLDSEHLLAPAGIPLKILAFREEQE